MGKLIRALGVVALVNLALTIIGLVVVLASPLVWPATGHSFRYTFVQPLPPIPSSAVHLSDGLGDQVAQAILTAWPPLSYFGPLLLSLFALVVAARTRRWGWLAIFLVGSIITLLAQGVSMLTPWRFTLLILVQRPGIMDAYSLWSFAFPALAALLALLFVASVWRSRAGGAAQEPVILTL